MPNDRRLTRRDFLKLGGGGAAALAGGGLLARWRGNLLAPTDPAVAAPASAVLGQRLHMAATDGWITLPGSIAPYMPDPAAPAAQSGRATKPTTYIFGFRNVTGFSATQISAQKNFAQASAPLWYIDQETDNYVTLSDLGLAQRPDLVDSHTIHFHGFRNAIPLFDGVPELSIAVPIGRDFTYFYRPHDPGTYMWHCHFEDVEHVQMGMTGLVFVRPSQNNGVAGHPEIPVARYAGGAAANAPLGYVYNDGVAPGAAGSTAYDREYAIFLSEVWATAHYNDAHKQVSDWSEYHADLFLMNGRVYPDTLAPNGGLFDANGYLIPPTGRPDLQSQPISSLIRCNAGDKVLLRFVTLGYEQAAMTLGGIPLRVIGKDATLLRGRDGTNSSYLTNTVYIGPGEGTDAIFTAPAYTSNPNGYNTYLLYNRRYSKLGNPGSAGVGGQLTEVHVYPAGGLAPQARPNDQLLYPNNLTTL